jgi:hypothetical protein
VLLHTEISSAHGPHANADDVMHLRQRQRSSTKVLRRCSILRFEEKANSSGYLSCNVGVVEEARKVTYRSLPVQFWPITLQLMPSHPSSRLTRLLILVSSFHPKFPTQCDKMNTYRSAVQASTALGQTPDCRNNRSCTSLAGKSLVRSCVFQVSMRCFIVFAAWRKRAPHVKIDVPASPPLSTDAPLSTLTHAFTLTFRWRSYH